ncbi:uncharacterized protein M6B38_356745 [Iris pallida]|uniref:Uncharacterized protein n=1 Tax=Iris pallida TaxID=29817 RepID=A0AAX6GN35_IRIPA|nr:uncharacterized protein M6B38_356745 [Iris pallida]
MQKAVGDGGHMVLVVVAMVMMLVFLGWHRYCSETGGQAE